MQGALATLPPGTVPAFAALLGLIFGSFVTALTYRLPRGLSVARGRSACPACGTALRVRDLVPVVSWLVNRGACRACGVRVSWRYPAIELATAALFVSAVLAARDIPTLAVLLAAAPVAVALAVIDIEHRRLPNGLILVLAAIALAHRSLHGADFMTAGVSALAVFILAVLLDHGGRRFLGQGLGMGDAKLMAILALALPPMALFAALAAAGILGVLTGLLMPARLTAGRTRLPFAPAILAGFWIALIALQ